jgi:hypothetical protein
MNHPLRAVLLPVLSLSALLAAGTALPIPSCAQTPAAQAPSPLSEAERSDVVTRLADTLDRFYVFPEVGARYAAMLRAKLADGTYAALADPAGFAAQVSADLQAVHPDAHLRLRLAGTATAPRRTAAVDLPASAKASGPPGMEAAEMLGSTAYLRFNMFPSDQGATGRAARDFLLAHAGEIRAVIIDERPHRGGGFEVMDSILPLFFAERTKLLRLDTRTGADVANDCRDERFLVPAPSDAAVIRCDHVIAPDPAETRLRDVPIYLLTSRASASAAEHLALAMKRTRRATLIGETSRGAGHYGADRRIGERFAAFVPVGRTYDPDTGRDWEGTGVAPDVAVAADLALFEAMRRTRSQNSGRPA